MDLRASCARPADKNELPCITIESGELTSCLLHLVALSTGWREAVCSKILADVAWVGGVKVAVTVKEAKDEKMKK